MRSAIKTSSGVVVTNIPRLKVAGAAVGAALSGILVFVLNTYANAGIDQQVAASITVVVTFALGWLTPPGGQEAAVG
ncbi:hypothetical protein [Sphingomonas sp. PAMC 26605]|uniref:hypothetical protein n=1 Tax=Sphingomonas sp. PAMC 26605 TaxID=1112214 RepID=UPI00026CA74D|nr:hypothetical protein [Sphingomonas sp. PAMC 26605]